MTRDEFLSRLGELLACLPAEQVEETKAFYAEAITDRMEDGMSEEEAVAAMGTPGEVAEATLDDLPAVPRAIARTRRRSTALLWALTIVGSPVWVPLLAAFAAVAVTVYICIWVLALCVWIVAAALGGAGVVGLLFAVSGVTIGHFPYALASAGVGLGLVGVALFVGAGAWAASKQIARLSALWADAAQIFSAARAARQAVTAAAAYSGVRRRPSILMLATPAAFSWAMWGTRSMSFRLRWQALPGWPGRRPLVASNGRRQGPAQAPRLPLRPPRNALIMH